MARLGTRTGHRAPLVTLARFGPAAVTVAGMIATPLARQSGGVRRALSSVVVTSLGATTFAASSRRWSPSRAFGALGAIGVVTLAAEKVGTVTGLPFGRYHYTSALRPRIGGVPIIVPLAWFAMAVPAREAAHTVLGKHSNTASRLVGGSLALTAWDLFLDPQMVTEGYWKWVRNGRYRGIPVSNFIGWFITGLGVMALLEVTLPPMKEQLGDATLVTEYGVMAAMETVGFAAFFKDRLVAVVGGAAMMPIASIAIVRQVQNRRPVSPAGG